MKVAVASLIATVSLLGACGDRAPTFTSAADIADAIGCTGLDTSAAERVDEAGTCEMDGERVAIFMFEDVEQRDEWMPFGERFSNDLIVGPDWAVDPPEGMSREVEEALL